MGSTEVALIAGAVVAFALVSQLVDRLPFSMPMVFVALGWISESVGAIELDLELEGIVLLGEVTLAIILFSDAVRIDVRALRRHAGLPVRLLAVGLPLSIALGTVFISLLLPGLGVWEAALVAAVLAPTDAALGQAVVEEESVPLRVRQGLNVESGLNDGLVLPAVLLFLALAQGDETEPGFWGRFILQQVGLGVVVGLAIGGAAGWLMHRARSAALVEGIYAQLGTLAVAVTAFFTAVTVEANGFLAAFIAGLAFGTVMPSADAEAIDEYTEDSGRLLAMVAFFVFGNVLLATYASGLTFAVAACALGALTLGRMLPVALSLIGMKPAWPTVIFVGWFGPRGLASILFGLILLEEDLPKSNGLFALISWTVLFSVVLHGATASWGASLYGRWFADMTEDELATMPEAEEVPMTRTRWGR